MKSNRLNRFLVVLLVPIILAACSSSTFPKGMYVAEESGAQLELKENGKFVYTDEGVVWATGTYSIDGNKLVWETDSSCDEPEIERATYTWSYENGSLVLSQQGEDLCEGRIRSVDQLEWRYQK